MIPDTAVKAAIPIPSPIESWYGRSRLGADVSGVIGEVLMALRR